MKYDTITNEQWSELMEEVFYVYESTKPPTREEAIELLKQFQEKYGDLPLSERPLFLNT